MMSNPQDRSSQKAYARAQVTETLTFDKFVQHIADHNGVYTKGTVQGVITDMVECLREMLLDGKKVELGDLGEFWISLSSKAADSVAEFSASNITDIEILYTPGDEFEDLRSDATFNQVSSRAAQVATLKAEKAGETTVDLAAAKSSSSSDTDDDADDSTAGGSSTGSDTGSGSGSGSDSGSGSGSGTDTGSESGSGDGSESDD